MYGGAGRCHSHPRRNKVRGGAQTHIHTLTRTHTLTPKEEGKKPQCTAAALHRAQAEQESLSGFVHSRAAAACWLRGCRSWRTDCWRSRGGLLADLLLSGEPTQEIKGVLLQEANVDRSH